MEKHLFAAVDLTSHESMTQHQTAKVTFSLEPTRVCMGLLVTVFLLAVAFAVAKTWEPVLGPAVLRQFDMNVEANLPTWFNSTLWLAAALIAYAIYRAHRDHGYPHAGYWLGMGLLFVFLSADEAGMIHENIGDMLEDAFGSEVTSQFTYPSVFFGMTLLLVIGGLYARFAFRLNGLFLWLFIASAVVFVSGAVIVETTGALLQSGKISRFPFGFSWPLMILIEETLEMTGVVLLIYTLLRILAFGRAPYRVTSTGDFTILRPHINRGSLPFSRT